ncbi:MAG: nucleotide exchange factor GrpE [Myxococcota bacterium]
MSDDLETTLQELRNDLRRQGRAAIAAQAAAEACLALLEATPSDGSAAGPSPSSGEMRSWCRPLLPALDSLDRVRQQAQTVLDGPRSGWLSRWRRDEDAIRLASSMVLLAEQLETALGEAGLEVERPRVGASFDDQRHRAVGRAPGTREQVVEVVRPGYRLGEELLREADVIVGDQS